MASIFTYQDEPPRVHSPWSTPGSTTPQIAVHVQGPVTGDGLRNCPTPRLAKLEPEKHDGPIEYKLHLLLRWRRTFTHTSTAIPAWSNQQHRIESASTPSQVASDGVQARATYQPSTQTRQARLQQLTTQLLWRLQQSSPFHSSSNKKLVLPVLPEATPRLGVPDRPAKLLPGLEESQGALYEIGVADDGTLVGLADEELEESLTNLRAMAASLGCVVDVHRRVIVGDCEWVEDSNDGQAPVTRSSKLWVAEVLVRPDNKSVEVIPADTAEALEALNLETDTSAQLANEAEAPKQHMRIALVGASASGKSSLLGTLTSSVLDDGRGKSRLSLLKHRHEISSGVTSSVAQELLGYRTAAIPPTAVVNYATGDVSSWPDIHNLADRLVFLSDSPGLPRYSKSTFRALISWAPNWTILCISADDDMQDCFHASTTPSVDDSQKLGCPEPNLSKAHLELCLKLGKPLIIVITKMDLATRTGIRQVLGHILSAVKAAGRTPTLFNNASSYASKKHDADFASIADDLVLQEQPQIDAKLSQIEDSDPAVVVPIVMTSVVSGSGVASLHATIRGLPLAHNQRSVERYSINAGTVFRTDEVFAIPPSKVYSTEAERIATDNGIVLCGLMDRGTIKLGDELLLGPFLLELESNDLPHVRGLRRSSSHHSKPSPHSLPRSLSEYFSKSVQSRALNRDPDSVVKFVRVRVVSLRNLRLPVSAMHAGDTGTVGIQSLDNEMVLNKARKGMILAHAAKALEAYRTFVASFPYSDFAGSTSPPLILGGHATAYVNSIRAPVKVTAIALDDGDAGEEQANGHCRDSSPSHSEVFTFDDEHSEAEDKDANSIADARRKGNLRISFRFLTTLEYVEVGDQILIVPTTTPAGPVTGPASTATIAGFSGFVGRICETSS